MGTASSTPSQTSHPHSGDAICPDDTLASAWQRLSVRYHQVSCEVDRALYAGADISGSEFEVLELLASSSNDSLRMSDLANRVHLSQSALSRLVSGLEKHGLVFRKMCDADRRSVFAILTDTGRDRYSSAKPIQRSVLRAHAIDDDGKGICGGSALY